MRHRSLIMVLLLSCCARSPDRPSSQAGGAVTFEVLAARGCLAYTYEEVERCTNGLPDTALVTFTDADLESAALDESPASRMELHMTREALSRHGPALMGLENHPFAVSQDGERLFVGLVYHQIGAAAINAPVLHIDRDQEDQVVLRLGARQGAWYGMTADLQARQRIDGGPLRDAFRRRRILRALGRRDR